MCELWRVGADASSKPVSNCLPCVDVTREGIRQRFSTSDTSTSGSRLGEMLCCYFPLKIWPSPMSFAIHRSTCRCVSRSASRLKRDQKANEPLDEEPLQIKDMQKPDRETLIILGTDLAVVLTCPQKLALKLQGEEASREDRQGKY